MEIRYKVVRPGGRRPVRASTGAGAYDLHVMTPIGSMSRDSRTNIDTYPTGIALEIPEGYVGLVVERSSMHKDGYSLANSVGVIDSDYRGEVLVNLKSEHGRLTAGRVAQLLIVAAEEVEFNEVETLSSTKRGDGGFGSTGK